MTAKRATVLFLLLLALARLAAQGGAAPAPASAGADEATGRVRIAISSIEYPVTPGDVYQLTYRQATGETMTRDIVVNGDYSIDFGIFGKIDASGLTFAELKDRAENLIMESYTRSLPSLTLMATGIFRVSVRGEVARIEYPTAWGLSRLSEVVERVRGPHASLRIVEVTTRSGETRHCDLLKAARLGLVDQDPLVRPGDAITLHLATRIVELSGEVYQPGRYELAPQEGLRDLIEVFGGGLTARAEPARVRIDRATERGFRSDYVSIPSAYETGPTLNFGDAVIVSSRMERRPVVWFEGAVVPPAPRPTGETSGAIAAAPYADEGDHGRIACPIFEGEMLSDALASVKGMISPAADLASASLIRKSEPDVILVDLQALLSGANPASDRALAANDRLVIPLLRSTVAVSGAVNASGIYPYQPGMPAHYYIGLAGGIDPGRNTDGKYRLLDPRGKRRKATAPIQPGDQIFVPSTTADYYAVRYAGIFTSIATIIMTLVLSISRL